MQFQQEVSKLGLCETYKGDTDIFQSGRYLLELLHLQAPEGVKKKELK